MIRVFDNLFLKFFVKLYLSKFSTFSTINRKEIITIISEEDIEEVKRMNHRYSSDNGFINDLKHRIDREIIYKIEALTFIIHSKYDKSVPFDYAEYAEENIKRSELLITNIWGYLIWIGREDK
ncbi:hypothetical protein [Orenia metallireducens]|nr:hypothetical protein [Orenia metallireducens]